MTDELTAPRIGALLDAEAERPDVLPGEAFSAWRLRVLSQAGFDALSPELQLAYLAWLDLLAPTSHNTVPQRFYLDAEARRLDVFIDREYVLAASDPTGRQAQVSIGAGLANAVLGARALGLEAEVELAQISPDLLRPAGHGGPRIVPIASLRLRAGAGPLDPGSIQTMIARKVVRAEYDERVKLDADLAARVTRVVAETPGLELHLITDAPTLLFLGKFQELADTTVFNREAFALELGAWLLANSDASPLGMRGAEFGLSNDVSRHIHRGLLREESLLPDEIAAFAKAGNIGMRSSSAVAVITVESDTVPLRIAAGRAYEEIALLLWRHGFCTAMHAGITEVDAPNMALRGRLRTRRRPTVVFRIGRPLYERDLGRPHASRPPLATLLLSKEEADRARQSVMVT